jgi:putative peptidoglycan lipid II flippase
VRIIPLQFLPSMHPAVILTRATVACVVGVSIYIGVARIFRIRELAELERMLLRKLRVWPSNRLRS